jgi:energy-converting hydrogenase Eha subunit C
MSTILSPICTAVLIVGLIILIAYVRNEQRR